jgi:hypothetical protein
LVRVRPDEQSAEIRVGPYRFASNPLLAPAHYKPAKDAIAIMATPIMNVAFAVLMATGFVNATRAIKTSRRTRITAERDDFARQSGHYVLEWHTVGGAMLQPRKTWAT